MYSDYKPVLFGRYTKKDTGLAGNHKNWCSNALVIRGRQIKIIMTCCFINTRVTTVKKSIGQMGDNYNSHILLTIE